VNVDNEQYYDWDHIATYAHGVGPDSKYVMYWPGDLKSKEAVDPASSSAFVEQMHTLGL